MAEQALLPQAHYDVPMLSLPEAAIIGEVSIVHLPHRGYGASPGRMDHKRGVSPRCRHPLLSTPPTPDHGVTALRSSLAHTTSRTLKKMSQTTTRPRWR